MRLNSASLLAVTICAAAIGGAFLFSEDEAVKLEEAPRASSSPPGKISPDSKGDPIVGQTDVRQSREANTEISPHMLIPEVGSEGYGPFIQRASTSGDPTASYQAALMIRACQQNRRMRDGIDVLRAKPSATPGLVAATIEALELEARRCQTVTHDLIQLNPSLLETALNGGLFGAAALFAQSSGVKHPPPLQQKLTAALKRDANDGDLFASTVLAINADKLELSAFDRRVYALVFQGKSNSGAKAMYEMIQFGKKETRLPPDEEARAEETAKEILEKLSLPGSGRK